MTSSNNIPCGRRADSHQRDSDSQGDRLSHRTIQPVQHSQDTETRPLALLPSQLAAFSTTQVVIPQLEPAQTHAHNTISDDLFTGVQETIQHNRVEFALRIPMEDMQLMSKAGWVVKARRNPNKCPSIKEIDVRYSTNSETLTAILH